MSTYSGCVFIDLIIQHAMRLRHIVLSCVACPVVQYIPTLPHKRYYLKKIEHKMCFDFI